jgi:hypothetical protein
MRSAIRGDFERLAERLGRQELMRSSAEVPEVAGESDEGSSGLVPPDLSHMGSDSQAVANRELGLSLRGAGASGEKARQSWFRRLVGS